jgi:Na+/H+-dicarboxylate symporter
MKDIFDSLGIQGLPPFAKYFLLVAVGMHVLAFAVWLLLLSRTSKGQKLEDKMKRG